MSGATLGLVTPIHAASDGDLRIEDGPSASHGRLEVFHDGQWGGVCDDFFSQTDATVACRQLGYTDGEARRYERRPLSGGMGFWLDNLNCAGTESQLGLCPHNGWGNHNCGAREAASVFCTGLVEVPTPEPATRLATSNATQTTMDLAWTFPAQGSGVTVTGVEVQQQSGATWSTVATLAADATSHTVTGLTAGTTYSFRVRLATSAGNADSDMVSASTLATLKPATGLTDSNPTTATVGLSWTLPTQPGGVTVTEVAVQQQSGTTWSTVGTLGATATTHTVSGLTAGTTYSFRIRLVTSSGNADSEPLSATTLAAPKPATSLTASNPTQMTVSLSWTLPAQGAGVSVTGVEVQQQSDTTWSTVGTLDASATTHKVTGLTAGTTYSFRIRLVTNSGNADSGAVSADTLEAPRAATGLAASDPTQTTVDLAWTLPAQPEGVTVSGVEVQQLSGATWSTVATLGASSTTHTVTELTSGTTYSFRIRVATSSGNADSDAVSATTIEEPAQQISVEPLSATGLAASNSTQTTVDLAWTLPAQGAGVSVTGVEVQQQAADETWSTVATLASDATSHTVTELTAGTSYTFRIRLVTSSGSADSDSVSASTLAAVNAATGLTASNATPTSVDLSWTLPEQPEGVTVTWVLLLQQVADDSRTKITLLATDATSHTVAGLTASTSYSFRIKIQTSGGNAVSDAVSADTPVAPKAATGLTASNVTHTTVDLSWTLPEQSEGVTVSAVEVLQYTRGYGTDDRWPTVATLAADATSYTITELAAGTDHSFRIRLVTSSGNADSTGVTASTLAGPKPPTELTASNETETTVDLAWTLPAHPDGVTVTGVEVRQEKANPYVVDEHLTRPTTTVATLAADATSYTVRGLTEVRRYTYRIRLITNGQGHADSQPVTISKIPNPRPPTGLAASNATSSTVDLSWTLPEQPEGVSVGGIRVWQEVEQEPLPRPPSSHSPTMFHFPHTAWLSSTMLGADTTSHTVTGLTPETEYRFKISLDLDIDGATNVGGAGPAIRSSEPVSVTTLTGPSPATGLAASNATSTTVDLAWTLPTQPPGVTVTGVEVQQQAADESWSTVAALPADAGSHTVTGLTAGTAYSFRIRLVTNSASADSDPASATTLAAPKPASGLSVSNATQTTVDLAWTLPAQGSGVTVTGVEVQQKAADQSWSTVATLAADATSHTVTGLTAGESYTFRVRLVTSSGSADSEPVEAQAAHIQLEAKMAGSAPSAEGRDDPGLSPSRSTGGGSGGCAVEVSVEFLDADGNAVAVDALAATDFTVVNGRVGTPVADADGLSWTVPGWATTGFTGLMRVRLPATERWEAAEQVFRVASDTDCGPVARNALASLSLGGLDLDPSFNAATTAYAAAAESDTAQVTVTASAVYGAASVAFAPGDADTEAEGHQVALAEGETQVTVTVTPGDGSAAQTYTVTVTREAAAAAVPPVAATQVPADWSLVPAGLSSGDRFRLLAVTSTKRHARVNSVRFYNAHVQAAVASGHADIRSYGPDFAMLGCTSGVDARTNTATAWTASDRGVAVYWLGGARVADDYADLYDGSWASNAATDESGEPSSDPKVFTGCASDGTVGDPLGARWVGIGQPGNAGEEMTDGATRTLRTMLRPLYALSPVFEVAPASEVDAGVLTGFVLVDASSDADLGAVEDGGTVTVSADGSYGIRAEVEADAEAGSVVLSLGGPGADDTHTRTENVAPYSLYGDARGAEHGRALAAGSYTLTATAHAQSGGAGDALGTLTVAFTVAVEAAPVTPPSSGVLEGFVLLDASDQSTVAALADGAQIDLGGRSGGSFGIRADVASSPAVGSVVLSLSGPKTVSRTENVAPYSLWGDDMRGTLHGGTLPAGTYTLSATAYAESGASGTTLGTLTVSFEVLAPAALSVADAQAEEGTDATLDFEVTLDRESVGTVTVDYATSDGTATAGEDYTATSGTLTFAPGDTEKTVSVPVLDDGRDEGEETLTLRLTNPSGATIADGEAVGTIANSDPIQKMWLSRFGRTVGSQVVDAVAERLGGPLAGSQVTLAGQRIDLSRSDDEAATAEAVTGVARALGGEPGWGPDPDDGFSGSGAWQGTGTWESPGTGALQRSMSGREALLGSAFHLSSGGEPGGPGFAAWGRVTAGGFDAQEEHAQGSVRMDGEVTTGVLGADAAWERWLAGVAVSVSSAEGTYDYPGADDRGTLESSLTGVHPYARVSVNERVQAWGLLGFGSGEMTMREAPNAHRDHAVVTRTDIEMRLGAVGARGALMEAGETGGLDLALEADAFLVQMESAKAANTEATEADASRLRLALEGSRSFALGEGAVLTPGLEVGLRHDGGDAETGTGIELGARIAWADAASGLSMEASARTLIAHEDSGYEEWGASGSVRLDPGASGRGLSLTVAPTLGAASSGVERLWSLRDARELANDDEFEAEGRLDAELAYGLPAFGAFTGTPYAGLGLSENGRDWRLGWRLAPGGTALDFALGVEGTWTEPANDDAGPEHGVMLRGSLRW